jgi:K+-sensing histidine kinase KdpD
MLGLVRILCPYPTVNERGEFQDGFLLAQPKICQKCKNPACRNFVEKSLQSTINHMTCEKGLSCLILSSPYGVLVCNGVILKEINQSCPSEIRKQYQSHKIALDEVKRWYGALIKAIPVVENQAGKNVVDAVNSLHDVTTGVSLVMRNAEAIIAGLPGETDYEKIDGAPDQLKSLLKSVQLLHRRLLMTSYVTNPESAAHGQKRRAPIYKIFHKMVRLFEQLAAKRNVVIRMTGHSTLAPLCYESIETIALVLIDNAIKYSISGGVVIVAVNDTLQDAVHVTVTSRGPIVPPEMRESIFEPRIRAPQAEEFAATGSGLGLYIAKVVAEAHEIKIAYSSTDEDSGTITGTNIFAFDVGP